MTFHWTTQLKRDTERPVIDTICHFERVERSNLMGGIFKALVALPESNILF